MMNSTNQQVAMHVSRVTILWNFFLTAFKLAAGLIGGSGAMISDGVHSASDVLSTLIVMLGVKLAGKESDQDHPYGHERLECVAALLLAAVLFATGLAIGWAGLTKLITPGAGMGIPGGLALWAAVISIGIKEGMYWYTKAAAVKINSGALMADAWHHRSDALSSVGSFAGILGARMGFPFLDPAASLIICLFIAKAAYDIFRDSIGKMTDHACDSALEEKMRSLALEQEGVQRVDLMKTRLFGDKIYVDIEIQVDGSLPLLDAHRIAQQVHDRMEEEFPGVKHCMVHVNPGEITQNTSQ